jgi:hypothetical protein
MINQLILEFPAPGSAYYLITNGWYIGQLGDYGACDVNTLNGQYMLITVDGEYTGPYPFTRGSIGKYQSFAPQQGFCVPRNCDAETVLRIVGPLVQRYAEDAYWVNTTVNITAPMVFRQDVTHTFKEPNYIVLGILGASALLGLVGCVI